LAGRPLSLSLTREPRPFDVTAFGENSVDLVARLPAWPAPDSKLALEGLDVRPGGQLATAAIACARLGARTRYVGVVGGDSWGDLVRDALHRNDVDARLIVRPDARTRAAVVLIDSAGRRTILGHRDPRLELAPNEVDIAWVTTTRLLMVDASDVTAAVTLARAARAAGVPVMADVDEPGAAADTLLSHADVVITSAGFPEAHTGCRSMAAALDELERRHHPAVLIATLGAAGAIARGNGEEVTVRAPAVDVLDTTGAGDAFRGAFAASWIVLGSEASLAEIVRRAVVAGALSCRALGAQGGLPTTAELREWL
jgi:sugar/nucleoside kinase (ribokinase family)